MFYNTYITYITYETYRTYPALYHISSTDYLTVTDYSLQLSLHRLMLVIPYNLPITHKKTAT